MLKAVIDETMFDLPLIMYPVKILRKFVSKMAQLFNISLLSTMSSSTCRCPGMFSSKLIHHFKSIENLFSNI